MGGRISRRAHEQGAGTPCIFLYSAELVEKYDIDIEKYGSIASLEPLLAMIAEKEPDCIPLFFDSSHVGLLSTIGYEYAAYSDLPLVVRTADGGCEVLNAFAQEDVMELLRTLRRYYQLGYINEDAAIRHHALALPGRAGVPGCVASGGPAQRSPADSQTFGYPIAVHQASESIVTSESTQGGVMAVNAYTQHPQECLAFLQALNTDAELRNLFNYGIEGVHYTLTENGQVRAISDGYTAWNTPGNWFILRTREGEREDKWDVYREFNDAARESHLLGFIPSYEGLETERDAVATVYQRYSAALFTGTVDPDKYVPAPGSTSWRRRV